MRKVIVLMLVAALTACSGGRFNLRSVPAVQASDFDTDIAILGIEKAIPNRYPYQEERYFLETRLDKRSGAVRHVLVVQDVYQGVRRAYDSAADDTARPLTVTSLNRSTAYDRKTKLDLVGVDLDEAMLRERRASGYRVRLSSKIGHQEVLSITPDQITAQLDALDKIRRR